MLRTFLGMDPAMGLDFYFEGGRADADKVLALVKYLGFEKDSCRILEFASGYGRITRHLSGQCGSFVASDIHPAAVATLSSDLGTPSVLSAKDPDSLSICGKYDFIFVISLFSHLPDSTFSRWIKALLSLTADGGCVMFTTHGPSSFKTSPTLPQIGPAGIGFIATSEQLDLNGEQYGMTTVSPDYVRQKIQEAGGKEISYSELEWWNLQDQWVVTKAI